MRNSLNSVGRAARERLSFGEAGIFTRSYTLVSTPGVTRFYTLFLHASLGGCPPSDCNLASSFGDHWVSSDSMQLEVSYAPYTGDGIVKHRSQCVQDHG